MGDVEVRARVGLGRIRRQYGHGCAPVDDPGGVPGVDGGVSGADGDGQGEGGGAGGGGAGVGGICVLECAVGRHAVLLWGVVGGEGCVEGGGEGEGW